MEEKSVMVGDAAKRLGVSVRTLQYYDKQGLMSPGGYSEGKRRLYSDKDIVRLNQILSLKYLGFSLEEIKSKLLPMDTPEQVIEALAFQERQILLQIENLTKIRESLGALKSEIAEMNIVDWNKYAEIIYLIRTRSDYYWIVKYFNDNTIKSAAEKFDAESAKNFVGRLENLWDAALALIDAGVSESDEQSQVLAKNLWDLVQSFTGGDEKILQDVMKFGSNSASWKNAEWKYKVEKSNEFLGKALSVYFEKNGIEVDV